MRKRLKIENEFKLQNMEQVVGSQPVESKGNSGQVADT